jgi:hypothetical protein
MRSLLVIGFVIAVGCAQAQDHRGGQIPETVEPAAYTVHVVDDEWDRVEFGYMKVREIKTPVANLEPCATDDWEDLLGATEAEATAELARLNDRDWDGSGWRESDYQVLNRTCYRAADVLIGLVSLRTIEQEYGAIAIGVLREGHALQLYAEADPYQQEATLTAYAEENGSSVVYGHRRGGPNQPHGGDFALAFQGDKRIIRYSYFEQPQ